MSFEANGSTWNGGSQGCFEHLHRQTYRSTGAFLTQTSSGDFVPQVQLSLHSAFAPGQPATKEVLDDAEQRLRLAGFINRLFNESNASDYEDVRMSKAACVAGKLVIDALPVGSKLPKIAADGDGGLIFAWLSPQRAMLLTLDGTALHFVDHAGTPGAVYFDKLPFSRHTLPDEVADAVSSF